MIPYIITNNNITIILNNKQYSINDNHINFKKIEKLIKLNKFENLEELFSIKETIKSQTFGKIKISDNDKLYYHDTEIHSSLTKRIIKMYKEGNKINSLVLFLENLMENPLQSAIDELYDFLDFGNLPITEDGHFLAYKKINKNYTDIYTGKIDNSINKVVKMDRGLVNPDRDTTCSTGLHFCSKNYLNSYGNHDDNIIVILKINPKHVVSIPSDYNNTKGRACEYLVLMDYSLDNENKILNNSVVSNKILSLTTKQKIILAYIDNFLLQNHGKKTYDLNSYKKDYPNEYETIIDNIMNHLLAKKIKRDTAVKYFKFVKDNFSVS